MKVSWLRDQDGRLRRELKPHMGRRLKGFDYSQKPITRMDALILNRIAQMISRDNAIVIDYKGCVFADIEMKTLAALSMSSL